MPMYFTSFYSFDRRRDGQVISSTSCQDVLVYYSRNPYGSHNLVLVDKASGEAFRHGNQACLIWLFEFSKHAYRRARRFLAAKGKFLETAFYFEERLFCPPEQEVYDALLYEM